MIVFENLGRIGRLGNALFQFAATVGLAATHGTVPRFNADWIHRPYFSVPDEFFGDCTGGIEAQTLAPHIDSRTVIYLQDIALFEHALPEIREYLKPSALARYLLEDFDEEFMALPRPILSVHVRRGDNVPGQDPGVPNKEDYYVLPGLDYYLRAMGQFRPASVAVFSDDPEWCEDHLPCDYVHRGVARPKEHEPDFLTAPVLDWIDLQLMARCDMHVVTGSTFGIWGALLAGDTAAVRPTPVYGPLLPFVNEDLMFPSTWKTLPVSCS